MMRPFQRRARAEAMTLIEVMVALAILGIVATVAFGGFTQTMRNKTRMERSADRSHVIRVALERMVRELSQAYVSMHINPNPTLVTVQTGFFAGRQGRGHRIDFTSFSHRRLYRDAHESDQNELSYFMTEDPDDSSRYVLARREQNRVDEDPQSGGTTQILVEDVSGFELEFLDPVSGEWTDTWDTQNATDQMNRLPVQVQIRLTVTDLYDDSRERTYATRAQPMIVWGLNHAVYQ